MVFLANSYDNAVMQNTIDIDAVSNYLTQLQDRISNAIQQLDSDATLTQDSWQRDGGGGGRSRVFNDGSVFEQAGVNFSHVFGDALPASASAGREDIAGRSFQAMGVSLVFHPHNPFAPTTHCNVCLLYTSPSPRDS